jgi:hypothetical protein
MFVYLQIGYFFRQDAMMKINDYIPDNELEILSIVKSDLKENLSDFKLYLDENEIKFGDEMYDIYKTVETEDSIHYYCVCDDNESTFELAFSTYLKDKTNNQTKNSPFHHILDNILKDAVANVNSFEFLNDIKSKYFEAPQIISIRIKKDIPTPPPRS